MRHTRRSVLFAVVLMVSVGASRVWAQPLGAFRWQLQPYCNVLTVTITQVGSIYRLEGRDDQCGAARGASVIGTASQNTDGSIGLGFNIVTSPAGLVHPVSAVISLATLSGTWLGAGSSGPFVFTPGAGTGGAPRPAPTPTAGGTVIPTAFSLATDGAFVAGGSLGAGGLVPVSGSGVRLMWYPRKAAVRAGSVEGDFWDDHRVGEASAAFNTDTIASGRASFATNFATTAAGLASFASGFGSRAAGGASFATGDYTIGSGYASFAGGAGTVASGTNSVALGFVTAANGAQSVALGHSTTAGGNQSVALGLNTSAALGHGTTASGDNSLAADVNSQAGGYKSVAMGLRVLAHGTGSVVLGSDAWARPEAYGSFIFGDRSTTTDLTAFIPNQFLARATGGVGFYTNAAMTIGVELTPGGSQWTAVSDVNAKHLFRDLDGEEVLTKLARMPIQEWSYKAQDSAVRHVGPTAQDFKAAFGLGEFALRIGTVDADGIALRAIQALEARTRSLMQENRELRDRLADLEARLTSAGAPARR